MSSVYLENVESFISQDDSQYDFSGHRVTEFQVGFQSEKMRDAYISGAEFEYYEREVTETEEDGMHYVNFTICTEDYEGPQLVKNLLGLALAIDDKASFIADYVFLDLEPEDEEPKHYGGRFELNHNDDDSSFTLKHDEASQATVDEMANRYLITPIAEEEE